MATLISTVENITLITLQGAPARLSFLTEVFDRISQKNINIDMISMAPTHADVTELSFTISDDDFIKVLNFTAELKKDMDVKVIVSSLNHKVSIFDENMKNTPGIASRVFKAIKHAADIRLITTSEVEISMLVTEADYDLVLDALCKEFN